MVAVFEEPVRGLDTPSKMVDIHEVIHRKLTCRKVCGEDLVEVVRNPEPHDPEGEFIVWHRNVSASSSSLYSVSLRHIMVVVS